MEFLFGFLVCYALGAAIELRNVLMFHEENGLAPELRSIVVTPLLWPFINWLDREDM